jgi:trehalose/maltose hydrolase-like predicted phosphorylase
MAGTVLIALTTFAGISFDKDYLSVQPSLPDAWESLSFGISFKGTRFRLKITKTQLVVNADNDSIILLNGEKLKVNNSKETTLIY